MPKNSILERSSRSDQSLLSVIWNKIGAFFAGLFNSEESFNDLTEKESSDEEKKFDDYSGIAELFDDPSFSDDRIDLNISTIWRLGDVLDRIGYRDGKSGQGRTDFHVMAKTLVRNFTNQIIRKNRAELSRLKPECESLVESRDYSRKLQSQKQNYILNLEKEKEANPNYFRRGVGYFYLTVSALLLIADIPLALQLTRDAFQLTGNESKVMCLGIALCTIIFKIFYDEFVGSPLDSFISQLKRSKKKDYDDKDSDSLKRNQKRRIVIKLSIIILTTITIISLAFIRFKAIPPSEQYGFLKENPVLSIVAFTLITLLFPIVSGVCMSIGLYTIGNARDLKRAKKQLERTRKDHIFFANKSENLQKQITHCENNISICEDEEFEEENVKYFTSRYSHGFSRGYVGPVHENQQPINDLFSKAETLHFKEIARKTMDTVSDNKKNSNGKT